jgi:hypothetical protein
MALKPAPVRCDAAGWPRDATPASEWRRGGTHTYFGGAYVEGEGEAVHLLQLYYGVLVLPT